MATAEEKRTITKKRLQELRNMCREHYNVLIEEGTMPDAADVRVTNQKLEELMELLDGKIKWDNAWLIAFLCRIRLCIIFASEYWSLYDLFCKNN